MKTDVTISKKMTINTGNYSSISPNVSLTVKDVDVRDVKEVSDLLARCTEDLFDFEIAQLSGTMIDIKEMGYGMYAEKINEMKDKIQDDLEDCSNSIINYRHE